MKIHEYQAKAILQRYGIPIPRGKVTDDSGTAASIAGEFGGKVIVKAQIHAGGRGKGGGVRLAGTPEEARVTASEMLGMTLVTPQTDSRGKRVRQVLIQEDMDIRKELYLGMAVDRRNACVTAIGSTEGGVEIEAVAKEHPGRICRISIDSRVGMQPFQARRLAFALDLTEDLFARGTKLISDLYRVFVETDASLVEINPLVITGDRQLLAGDAKMNFDDNALYRHPDIAALRDIHEEEPAEAEASGHKLSYVKLEGNIGCMVNGAGLAMATMDIIRLFGSMPANFLDVGGAASSERVEQAFRIFLNDKHVKTVLINIFGGIVRCDRVARGLVEAAKHLDIRLPIVVRLAGTNSELAADILRQSGFSFTVAPDLQSAAREAVALAAAAR